MENALDFEETFRKGLAQYFLLPDRDSLWIPNFKTNPKCYTQQEFATSEWIMR